MVNAWSVLGLEPTRDVSAIRRAYARKSRECHPEEDPEGFLRLREAYQAALAYAQRDEAASAGQAGPESAQSPEEAGEPEEPGGWTLAEELYRIAWQKLDLKTAVMGRAKILYGALRERVLERLPDIGGEKRESFGKLRAEANAYFMGCYRRAASRAGGGISSCSTRRDGSCWPGWTRGSGTWNSMRRTGTPTWTWRGRNIPRPPFRAGWWGPIWFTRGRRPCATPWSC